MLIFGFDISSTNIGWVINDNGHFTHGTIKLKGELWPRISAARDAVAKLIIPTGPREDAPIIAYEGPAYKASPMAIIAQQRVVGVVVGALLAAYPTAVIEEIAPTSAKKALAGNGRADKHAMIAQARLYLPNCTEHEADALGVYMAALGRITLGVAA